MIGRNINSYNSLSHNHTVTDCIHKEPAQKPEGKNKMQGANISQAEQQQKHRVGAEEFLFGGLKGFIGRSKGFFLKMWYSGSEDADGAIAASAVRPSSEGEAVRNENCGILAASAVRPSREEEAARDESSERKVGNIEETVSGGLKREEGGMRKFLKQFSEKITRHSRRASIKTLIETEKALSENNTDFGNEMGDNSYLLDSYNKSGEYTTLAKNRKTEGNFKVRG